MGYGMWDGACGVADVRWGCWIWDEVFGLEDGVLSVGRWRTCSRRIEDVGDVFRESTPAPPCPSNGK